ncbi:MAG: sigma-70 family RNA polymerase sigma factor [Oscillospiraceae bacterium]|nr:sigma-70 family RNA polymerase sigma factor [Oscillospiraceae bacterium]
MAVRKLYERYRQDVYRYLMSLTKDPALAEDLLSETFLGAIRSLPGFRGKADVKTWLFSIARKKWADHLRREKIVFTEEELAGRYLAGDDPESVMIRKEAVRRIRELLDAEPERAKQTVLMRIEGYSFREIAGKLGLSENSVRVIDHRTRKKIREILLKEGLWDERDQL